MRKGYIYVLSNESMPGVVKIGKSTRGGKHRAREIYQTGVPTPFSLEFEMMFDDSDSGEVRVHDALSNERVSSTREFFKVEVRDAVVAVVSAHIEDFDYEVLHSELAYAVDQADVLAGKNNLFILDVIHSMSFLSNQAVKDSVMLWNDSCLNAARENSAAREAGRKN
jgi:hypothetical protein